MKSDIERLYHLAEADSLHSIRKHGLMSAERLLDLVGIAEPQRTMLLRQHRPKGIRLSNGQMIRDQRPMPPAALAGALEGGLEPSDWYALLNSFVFFWPNRERLDRQRRACGERPQVMLTFDSRALLERFGADAFVSPINSGNARRKAAQRGRQTFVPFKEWSQNGWPSGLRWRPPAEFLFQCVIPAEPPYLLNETEV
jgi:hypothetical protein